MSILEWVFDRDINVWVGAATFLFAGTIHDRLSFYARKRKRLQDAYRDHPLPDTQYYQYGEKTRRVWGIGRITKRHHMYLDNVAQGFDDV